MNRAHTFSGRISKWRKNRVTADRARETWCFSFHNDWSSVHTLCILSKPGDMYSSMLKLVLRDQHDPWPSANFVRTLPKNQQQTNTTKPPATSNKQTNKNKKQQPNNNKKRQTTTVTTQTSYCSRPPTFKEKSPHYVFRRVCLTAQGLLISAPPLPPPP